MHNLEFLLLGRFTLSCPDQCGNLTEVGDLVQVVTLETDGQEGVILLIVFLAVLVILCQSDALK